MRILIIGAGSIGVYLDVMLHKNKHDVTLLGGSKLHKLNKTILIGEKIYAVPEKIYTIPKNEHYDYVFITSKLYDFEDNLKKISENNISSDYLISIQNGIVENQLYKKYIGETNFTTISVFEGFRLLENQSNFGWKTDDSAIGKNITELLSYSGVNCTTDKNLNSLKAEKTILNCCVNILSALKRQTLFELYSNKETILLIDNIFDESYSVLSIEYKLKEKELLRNFFFETLSPMKHYTTTYQDAVSGRKTEIPFINGFIVELGKKYHIKTPVNEKLISDFTEQYPKSTS